MQNLRVLLREAEETIIQLKLVKARISKEHAKKVELAEGANNSAKKRKVLAGLVIKGQKAVFNMDSFYREKLFGEPAKKKKPAADKNENDKKDETDNESLVLASKQVRIMSQQNS